MDDQSLPRVQGQVDFILDFPRCRIEKPYYISDPREPDQEFQRTNAIFETKTVQHEPLLGLRL